jgi:hypothetical protein
MDLETKYWWCRIFTFIDEKETTCTIPISEFYIVADTLAECKRIIIEEKHLEYKYWAKPKKEKADYLKIMESTKYYYDRYNSMQEPLHDYCYMCQKEIDGKFDDYKYLKNYGFGENQDEYRYFCSYECKQEYTSKKVALNSDVEEWQSRTNLNGVLGYIYHIYNKATHKHYIGQTKYMPFFRWQEHIKSNKKGNIEDLVFETLCEIYGKEPITLNKAESHYINLYIKKYGENYVMNDNIPKFNFEQLELDYLQIKNKKVG